MADGLNRAILVGNLGADPELKHTQSGQAVLRLRLAVNESFRGKDGEKKERVEWLTTVIWGKRAEALNKLLGKGSRVWVEGRIQTRSWEAKDGSKRYATEINASDLGLLGGGPQRQGGGAGGGRGAPQGGGGQWDDVGPGYDGDGGGFTEDDNLPF